MTNSDGWTQERIQKSINNLAIGVGISAALNNSILESLRSKNPQCTFDLISTENQNHRGHYPESLIYRITRIA